jgi:hypothetical protein
MQGLEKVVAISFNNTATCWWSCHTIKMTRGTFGHAQCESCGNNNATSSVTTHHFANERACACLNKKPDAIAVLLPCSWLSYASAMPRHKLPHAAATISWLLI